ncbi:MAG TPA: FG-GAP-like repeat-containing protein [Candidatus Cloacimonadota bacterium]|nr:FG-GAP-like repeat-containing protein [Candidatus Cloacimonadota bacterium]
MKRNAEAACFLILVLFCGFSTEKCYAQAALHEIVRFNIPFGRHFSFHAETGGDLNGDGRPDLVFSCVDELNYSNCPLYIYYSIPDSNAVPDQILTTPWPNVGGFGYSLAYAGDLNGDSISDMAVGVRYYGDGLSGGILIYYGGNPPFVTPDVFISGVGMGYTHDWDLFFGEDMITDCDLNGDGINDLLVYAPGPQYEEWGNVYAYLGGEPFATTPALHIRGAVPYERLGTDMKTGDINGDGYDDIVLTNRVPVNPGELYGPCHYHLKIYSGSENLTNVPIFETLLASAPAAGIGGIIANGDLNGDGYDDILISGGSQTDSAWLKVFYGQDDLTSLQSVDFDLGYNYYTIKSYVNLDNDPFSDLWVKLYQPMPYDPYEGSYAVYKQISEVLNLIPDYVDSSPEPRQSYGYCYPLGDMNNDGSPEFFVYAYPTINPPCLAYATILSESYVSNSDEYIQPARVMINCYPNPFRDGVNVRIVSTDKSIQLKSMEVFNLKGQLVYTQKNLHGKQICWDGQANLGNKIGSGIYVVRALDTKGNIHTTKVVKMK